MVDQDFIRDEAFLSAQKKKGWRKLAFSKLMENMCHYVYNRKQRKDLWP